MALTLSVPSTLGLKVNVKKLTLHPTQQVAYIRGLWDALPGRPSLPPDRISKIRSMLLIFHPGVWVPASQVQRLLGLMASTTAVVQHAGLKMRSRQAWYFSLFSVSL